MNYNVNRKKCLKLTYGNTNNFVSFLALNILISSTQIFSIFIVKDYVENIGKTDFNISYYVITFIASIVLLLVLFAIRNKIKSNICNNVTYNLIKDAYASILSSNKFLLSNIFVLKKSLYSKFAWYLSLNLILSSIFSLWGIIDIFLIFLSYLLIFILSL